MVSDNAHYVSTSEGDTPIEVQLARILRRWSKANGKHKKVRLTVPDARREHDANVVTVGGKLVDTITGEVLERRLTLTKGPFVGRGAGFVLVNDGVQFMRQLRRAVDSGTIPSVPKSIDLAHDLAQRRIDERRRARNEYTAALGIIIPAGVDGCGIETLHSKCARRVA